MRTGDPGQAGFSLVELMVAMVMTLIVSGAIFGLLTGGQNAFRREPELTDRQQNIRVAMDVIKRDVAAAGAGMVPFVQAFTNSLDGQGPANPSSVQTAGAIAGDETDVLEILTSSGTCPAVILGPLGAPPPAAGPLPSPEVLPRCFANSAAPNTFFYVGSKSLTGAELTNYGVVMGKADVATQIPFNITVVSGPNLNPPAGFCTSTECTVLQPIEVVRYLIAPDPDDASLPALWRSSTGAFTAAGAASATPPGANWQVVARGIDDLQIAYLKGAGTWDATPGVVSCAPCTPPLNGDLDTIVRQVRITLSARASGKTRIQGTTTAAAGSNAGTAIRGSLVAIITPRAALTALTVNSGATKHWF